MVRWVPFCHENSYAATADRSNVLAYYSQGVLFSRAGKAGDAEAGERLAPVFRYQQLGHSGIRGAGG